MKRDIEVNALRTLSVFIALLMILVFVAVMFIGCVSTEDIDETEYEYIPMHFNKVGETRILGYRVAVMMHTETGVLYLFDSGDGSGITALLNADGTPMTYDQFTK